jgi:predicted RNA-binding Zn ribbon-like protein
MILRVTQGFFKRELIVSEHHPGTPDKYRDLESFLWHDFEAGRSDWAAWLRRKMPDQFNEAAKSSFRRAMHLHAALRSLQAANSGMRTGEDIAASRETLNRLISRYRIRPRLDLDGQFSLATEAPTDPIAALILMLLDALQSGLWKRFKLCYEPTCRASYYDASKPGAKTWCSMDICGSRNKMKRYRAKNRAQG